MKKTVAVIIVLLVLACLFVLFIWPAPFDLFKSQSEDATESSSPALASKLLANGLLLELVQATRCPDGLVEMRWRYTNPANESILLCSTDEGRELREKIYSLCDGKKYYPFKSGDRKLVSNIAYTELGPSEHAVFWGKFDIPAEKKPIQLSLFIPGLTMPFERIEVDERPEKTASEKHLSGLVVSIEKVELVPGDMVEVRWKYHNPTGDKIHLFSTDSGRQLPSKLMLELDRSKTIVTTHSDGDGVFSASSVPFTSLEPGRSVTLFAKFKAKPAPGETVTFYVPDTPPLSSPVAGGP